MSRFLRCSCLIYYEALLAEDREAKVLVDMPDKKFYSITEVSKVVGAEPHVLRYWETEFSKLRPRKNRAGRRDYEKKDIELILRIKELLYEELYTIAGAKKKLYGKPEQSSGRETLNFILSDIRKELLSILELLKDN